MPDIPKKLIYNALLGRGSKEDIKLKLPPKLYNFIKEYYYPVCLVKITGTDIDKFIKRKPEITKDNILSKLPLWLYNLAEGFIPQNAD